MKHSRNFLLLFVAALSALLLMNPARAALIGYWSLDGDSDADAGGWGSSTVGSGGNGNVDYSFQNDVPTEIGGRAAQSLNFDSDNDDYITTAFNAGTAGVDGLPTTTLSYWIKRGSGTVGNRRLVYFGNASGGSGGVISFERAGTSNNLASYYFNGNRVSSGGFLQDSWIHVALTYETNHGTSNIYIDGVQVNGSVANSGNFLNIPANAGVSFGAGPDGGTPGADFNVADFAIWNEVLTTQQISDLASGTSPLVIPEPGVSALIALMGLGMLLRRRRA